MQLKKRVEQIHWKSHLIQVGRGKMQTELIHKRALVELQQAASISVRSHQREADHKQELLTRIWQLQGQETKVEKLKE